jgi:hypothetical protein
MAKSCEFCRSDDLHDDAKKCRHCGSWLVEPPPDYGPVETLRKELREEHTTYRAYLEGLLTQLRWAAAIIVGLALAATGLVGWQTNANIADSAERLERQSRAQMETAATAATENARLAMIEKLNSPQTQAQIEAVIEAELARLEADVEQRVAASRAELDNTIAQVNELQADAAAVRASFATARNQTLADSPSRLPLERVRAAEKEGLGELEDVRTADVEALTFTLGGYYDGPIVWKYLDTLLASARFKHVILLEPDDTIFGIVDAAALAAQLNPPEQALLRAEFGGDVAWLPDATQVPGWSAFAEAVMNEERDRLRDLPMFVGGDHAVSLAASSVDALKLMEELGVDRLPVVDADNRFAGIVERGRLATRVLLDLTPTDT